MQLTLRYNINVEIIPENGAEFAVERPDLYKVRFNGMNIDTADTGWWCDLAIRKRFHVRLRTICTTPNGDFLV